MVVWMWLRLFPTCNVTTIFHWPFCIVHFLGGFICFKLFTISAWMSCNFLFTHWSEALLRITWSRLTVQLVDICYECTTATETWIMSHCAMSSCDTQQTLHEHIKILYHHRSGKHVALKIFFIFMFVSWPHWLQIAHLFSLRLFVSWCRI